jgi:hypothetical protein
MRVTLLQILSGLGFISIMQLCPFPGVAGTLYACIRKVLFSSLGRITGYRECVFASFPQSVQSE